MSAVSSLRPWLSSFAFLALLVSPLAAQADIPVPGNRPRPRPIEPAAKEAGAPLEVVLQEGGKPMRLEIPRALLPKEATEKRGGVFGGLGDLRTIIGGLALSLAVVVGGLWLVRRFGTANSRPLPRAATVGMVVTLVVSGLAVATAWADLLPPGGRPRPRPVEAGLKLQVVVVEGGESLVLYANAADLAKMAAAVKGGFGAGFGAPKSAPPRSAEP